MATIFLTGGTGLIGGAVLHAALTDRTARDRWICLVRAENADMARTRLAGRLQRFCSPETAVRLLRHVEVIAGDVTEDGWTTDPRLPDVSHVLHLAADTSWWGEERVQRTNHHGTLAFARRAASLPRLERFLHVSTAMICGAGGGRLVDEASFPAADATHLVPYSRSKAAAEMALARDLPDLPLVVARPSIVVGHTTLGAQPSSSILWVFRAADRLRLVGCDLDGAVDVVPSDWTASTLLGLLEKPQLAHSVYHLSAGETRRSSWSSLARAFETADPDGGRRLYERLHPAEPGVLRRRFEQAFGTDTAHKVTMLRAMQAYYRFCELNVTFSNERLLAEGFSPPPPFAHYLPNCVDPDMDIVAQFADDSEMFAATPSRSARPARRTGRAGSPLRLREPIVATA